MVVPALNLKRLPNYPALQFLYKRYYAETAGSARSGSTHVSSHWNQYSRASHVEIDGEGHLRGFQCEGFGSYQDERLLKRLADYFCCLIHFLLVEGKLEVFRLAKMSRALAQRIPFGHHYLSYDLFRQVHALATINRHFRSLPNEKFIVVAIGDGFGFLAALIKWVYPSASVIRVDIGRTLFFQCLYLQVLYPSSLHAVAGYERGSQAGPSTADFLYCPTEDLQEISDHRFRLAINVCSMQEMTKAEIERYFRFLRSNAENGAFFYCCNRECKVLPDGEKVEFAGYPWLPTDRHLVDCLPSVYRFWFSSRRTQNGPRVCGLRVPFVNGPDGPIRHRLTLLSRIEPDK
jgi:hypothetical protein